MNLSVEDVVEAASQVGLSQYRDAIIFHQINGDALTMMEDKHIKEIGINLVGHRLLFMKMIDDLLSGRFVKKDNSPPPQRPKENLRASQPSPASPKPSTSSSSRASQTIPKKTPPKSKPAPLPPESQAYYEEEKPKPKPKAKAAPLPPEPQAYYEEEKPKPKPKAKAPPKAARTQPIKRGPPPPDDGGDDDRVSCSYCGRKFSSDRIEKHEEVCARMSSKRTKVFDSRKQRLEGSEAAQFTRNMDKPSPKPKDTVGPDGKKSFQREHEKLVESLRAARKLAAYEKAREEGKAVGPPPELPKYEIENDDRVPCPYCGRKFGQENAQRHINTCPQRNAQPVKRRR